MDKVRKILSSPITRRKNQGVALSSSSSGGITTSSAGDKTAMTSAPQPRLTSPSYIGVSLETLQAREGRDIPKLVTRVCTFLLDAGTKHNTCTLIAIDVIYAQTPYGESV